MQLLCDAASQPAVTRRGDRMANPFTPKFGYVPPLLVGRDGVLNRIAAGRTSTAHPDSALLLTGQRGTGKTVLLHVALDEAREQQWVTLFASGAEIGLCDKLASQCIDNLGDAARRIVGLGAQALGFGASISRSEPHRTPPTAFRFALEKAAAASAERGAGTLIAVDELQDAPITACRAST